MNKKNPTKKSPKTRDIDHLTPKQQILLKNLKKNLDNKITGKQKPKTKGMIIKLATFSGCN